MQPHCSPRVWGWARPRNSPFRVLLQNRQRVPWRGSLLAHRSSHRDREVQVTRVDRREMRGRAFLWPLNLVTFAAQRRHSVGRSKEAPPGTQRVCEMSERCDTCLAPFLSTGLCRKGLFQGYSCLQSLTLKEDRGSLCLC